MDLSKKDRNAETEREHRLGRGKDTLRSGDKSTNVCSDNGIARNTYNLQPLLSLLRETTLSRVRINV